MTNIVKNCGGLITEHPISEFYNHNIYITGNIENNNLLKYYDIISQPVNPSSTKPINKENVYLLFGEHPRELISTELGYYFIKQLCINKDTEFKSILENYNIRIIVNSNPYGRQKVEKGEYCRRSNLHNVDINRNWDYSWSKDIEVLAEEYPGTKPFSELETLFIHDTLKIFKPKIFLTIHSGFYGLFLPYAYDSRECKKNNEKMKAALTEVKTKFCSICKLGSPSLLIGYKSSGTSLDYAFTKFKVPFTFAWEIYSNEEPLPEMQKTLGSIKTFSFLQTKTKMKYKTNKSLLTDLLYNENKNTFNESENEICFELFNPLDQRHYDYIVNNWTNVNNYYNF